MISQELRDQRIKMIRDVRCYLDVGLKEAKEAVDEAFVVLDVPGEKNQYHNVVKEAIVIIRQSEIDYKKIYEQAISDLDNTPSKEKLMKMIQSYKEEEEERVKKIRTKNRISNELYKSLNSFAIQFLELDNDRIEIVSSDNYRREIGIKKEYLKEMIREIFFRWLNNL